MKNKKVLFLVILSVIVIGIGLVLIFCNTKESVEKIDSNSKYLEYELKHMKKTKETNNVVIWYEETGTIREEYKVKEGSTLKINKFGTHNIKIKKVTKDKITISLEGLAPSKKDGTFSLTDKYENVVIDKEKVLQLNVQATDLYQGYIYFFYVPKE